MARNDEESTPQDVPKRKVWVITGTSSGLGHSLVQFALARGDYVAATARDVGKISDFTDDPEVASRVLVLKLDVTAPFSDLRNAAGQVVEKWGHVDVLINNAGTCLLGIAEEIGAEGYRKQFDVNFFGQLSVTNAFLPYMRAQREGTIVFIGSRSSWRANVPLLGPYASSKAAITAAAESLAVEVAPFGIKVLNVLPGGLKQSRTWYDLVFLPTVPEALLPPTANQPGLENVQSDAPQSKPSSSRAEDAETGEQHISDYLELRKRMVGWSQKAGSLINGDLDKCAKTIVDVVSGDIKGGRSSGEENAGNNLGGRTAWPDLNMLILGTDAEENIGDKCRAILKNLDEWKDVVRRIQISSDN